MLTKSKNNRLIPTLFTFYILLILFLGLWPFDFCLENTIQWDTNNAGVVINKMNGGSTQGIIYSLDYLVLPSKHDELSIELAVKPFINKDGQLHSILNFDDGSYIESITFAQWHSAFIIHNRIQTQKEKIVINKIGVDSTLISNKKKFFTITSGKDGTKIYVNGIVAASNSKLFLIEKDKKEIGRIIVGASKNGKRQWNGKINYLAIYPTSLSSAAVYNNYQNWQSHNYENIIKTTSPMAIYSMNEQQGHWIFNKAAKFLNLYIPSKFKILQKRFFMLDFMEGDFNFGDILLNILGFIPFGFLIILLVNKNQYYIKYKYFFSIFICILISCSIEISQAYMPSRTSSLQDLFLNCCGGVIGILCYIALS